MRATHKRSGFVARRIVVIGFASGTGIGNTRFGWRDLLRARNAFFVAAYASFGIAYISYATFAVAAFHARGVPLAVVTAVWTARRSRCSRLGDRLRVRNGLCRR